jgi:hypothetical protein
VSFPEYPRLLPLPDGRSWSAELDSYDQRNENVYYEVTLHDPQGDVARFMVQVDVGWAPEFSTPDFTGRLRGELGRLAAAGVSNTDYAGYRPRRTG